VLGNTPEQFAAQIKAEYAVYKKVVDSAKLRWNEWPAARSPGGFFTGYEMLAASLTAIDAFIDALWLEEGLSRNTLAAYRRDLTLYATWLANQARSLDTRPPSWTCRPILLSATPAPRPPRPTGA
jgi:hypothetical protein